jgi:hypothetical protein
MSAELPISRTTDQAYSAAVDDVNRWRGHCIECCARIERATGKALAAVSAAHPKPPPIMFGERMKALRALVEPQGSHSNPALLKCLVDIEDDLALRNVFVHATGSVWIHPTRGWLWSYRFDPMQKGRPCSSLRSNGGKPNP